MEKIEPNGRVIIIKSADNLVNISFVDGAKEYELTFYTEDFFNGLMKTLKRNELTKVDAEIEHHPACCEHPDGC